MTYSRPMLRALALALTLVPVGQFDKPVFVAAPPGDAHRIFVVEKTGRIEIVSDGQRLATPFLSLAGQVSGDNEQGLLSMAFAPDYATSGRFYVDYTDTDGNIQVVEYRASANPDAADPASARPLLSVAHPGETNHNGGQLQFGPDGGLYVGIGDGGGSGDPNGNGQSLSTLLGKIVRIDPASGAHQIWAYGLRNPWRFSFDAGNLWIGDVGQDNYEEIDREPASAAGLNYGWSLCEGFHDFHGSCAMPGLTAPILEYSHDNGRCAVTGGYVVHDASLPSLDGAYVYGDYCSGEMWAVRPPAAPQQLAQNLSGLSSFGLDACGHLYAMSSDSGQVVRFAEGSATACTPTGTGTPAPPPAARAVTLRVRAHVSRSGRAAVRVGCNAAFARRCRVTLTLRRGRARAATTRRFYVRAGSARTVHDRLTRRLRRSLAHRHRRVAVRASAIARDASGSARRSVRVRLSR
jgi:hypothetical protein